MSAAATKGNAGKTSYSQRLESRLIAEGGLAQKVPYTACSALQNVVHVSFQGFRIQVDNFIHTSQTDFITNNFNGARFITEPDLNLPS